jgi:DNA polymerase elongation subunit (family B)
MDEPALLRRFIKLVRELDPDVIEGHNIFNFDLPYLAARAKRWKIKLALGRDGSGPRARPSRYSPGDRTIAYQRFDIAGRHVIDTLFLAHAYDVSHRALDGFGLKEIARHFGLSPKGRTYIEGAEVTATFARDPERVMKYVADDIIETRDVSSLLSMSSFLQAQMLPYTYQAVAVRGNAVKIDSLMIREYLREKHALPLPGEPHDFGGGYTDIFKEGVIVDVHHCDIRSLYPSLMLNNRLAPATDELGVFLRLLDLLRSIRLRARDRMAASRGKKDRAYYDVLQATFKILINSFYGYLGFSQARFCDFEKADAVTSHGRKLLQSMIRDLRKRGAEPVEIDTDGIYFVPPKTCRGNSARAKKALEAFRAEVAGGLPKGIDLDFDGEYKAMYSHKMKNYVLLSADGEMTITGAALKSRGLEPFQRRFMRELIRMRLEGKDSAIPKLKAQYEKAIMDGEWHIQEVAKTETLQDSPGAYTAKRAKGRPRSAAYELALASGREYRAGDQVSYYVTGTRKTVKVYESARLASEWDPKHRDENVAYYLGKLAALYKKFSGDPGKASTQKKQ